MNPTRLAVLIAIAVLVGVFVAAAVGKFNSVAGTAAAARALGVPPSLAPVVARVLPPLEAVIAISLLFSTTRRIGAVGAGVTLLTFTIAIVSTIRRGHRPTCHCFGSLASTPIGYDTVIRNAALIVLAAVVAVLG
jgi:uncharacterized membrane protein YphA (DoxX/SURF4 family)